MHNQQQNTWSNAFGSLTPEAQSIIEKAKARKRKPEEKQVRQPKQQKIKTPQQQRAAKTKNIILALSKKGRGIPHILKFLKRVDLHYLAPRNMLTKVSRLRIKHGYKSRTGTKYQQIVTLYKAGKTYDEIKQATGSPINYIRDCLKKHGLLKRKKHTQRKQIEKLINQGKTSRQIAKLTGVSLSTVTRNRKRIKQCQSTK